MKLTQTGDSSIEYYFNRLRRCYFHKTPAKDGTLPKDVDGDCCNADFNYASIVGILLYLLGHSRPELAFSASQCAHCTFSYKISHKKALKRIRRYLINTRTKLFIVKSSSKLKIDCYVSSDFVRRVL